jgi:putative phosphoribosyl transferase
MSGPTLAAALRRAHTAAVDAPFANRQQAGAALAAALQPLALHDPVVLALPRGGVPVAAEIARVLHAPLDLLLVRKIGAPGEPELAVAAVVDAADDDLVVDTALLQSLGVSPAHVQRQAVAERAEIARRRAAYLGDRRRVPLDGRTVILVDDGIATGTTVRAAIKGVRRSRPAALVLAVPVAPPDTVQALAGDVDRLVCLRQPQPFRAVGLHYVDFHQVPDAEVVALLDAAR